MTGRPAYLGTWHWDDVRASIDAVIASLPKGHRLAARLEHAEDGSNADSTLVYRWGVVIAEWHGLEEPWLYGSALVDSTAIFRPSLATREARAAGEVYVPDPELVDRWNGFRTRVLATEGMPLDDEP